MLGDITIAEKIYIACGYTDMRKSIDGLATLVQSRFEMDPFEPALFIFCGRKCDRIKALLWEAMVSFSSTKDWRTASSSGLVPKKNSCPSPGSSFAGLWKVFRSSRKRSSEPQKSAVYISDKTAQNR